MIDSFSNFKNQKYYDFTGSVNLNVSELLEKPSEFEESINLIDTKLGSLQQAPWKTAFGTSPVVGYPVLGAVTFRDTSNVGHRIIAQDASGHATSSLIEIGSSSNTVRKTGLTAGKNTIFAQTFGYLFAMNSVDGLISSTGALSSWGTVNCVGAPKTNYIIEYNKNLYALGDPNMLQRVYKGFIQDPEIQAVCYVVGAQTGATLNVDDTRYLQIGMSVDIVTHGTSTILATYTVNAIPSRKTVTLSGSLTVADTDEIYLAGTKAAGTISILWDKAHDWFDLSANGQPINGAAVSNNRLIIMQENVTYKYDGTSLSTVDPVVGCSSWQSIATVGRFTFWHHKGAHYKYDGFVPIPISNPILPILLQVPDYTKVVAIPDRFYNRIFVYLGTLTAPAQAVGTDMWGVYDIFKDSWRLRSDMNAVVVFRDNTVAGVEAMLIGDNQGQLWQIDTGTASNLAYSMKTKYDGQNNPNELKAYRFIAVVSTSPGGNLFYSLDYNRNDYLPLGKIKDNFQIFPFPENAQGNVISIRWADDRSGASPDLLGYTIFYQELGYEVSTQ
jgi:hypothetical protein